MIKKGSFLSVQIILVLLFSLSHLQANPSARVYWNNKVSIEVFLDNGRVLPFYKHSTGKGNFRAFLQRQENENFSFRIKNNAYQRLAIILAVDGRNIIDGRLSNLQAHENMFLLQPDQQIVYSGSSHKKQHKRFNFKYLPEKRITWHKKVGKGMISIAIFEARRIKGKTVNDKDWPVLFRAKKRAVENYFIKYKNHETLCSRNILDCPKPTSVLPKIRWNNDISVAVVKDNGEEMTLYRYAIDKNKYRAYLAANKNKNYALKITNNRNYKMGLVIAVDGRNIISGKRSELAKTEKMYILTPGQTRLYEGWRSAKNYVNRFRFANEKQSYAAAWQDLSAVGTIAIASYAEQPQVQEVAESSVSHSHSKMGRSSRQSSAESAATAYGDEQYSASVRVDFRPQAHINEKYVIKYEWREQLCQQHIIDCHVVHEYAIPPHLIRK